MQESTNLKRAKIIPFTAEEKEEISKRASKYLEENNKEELKKIYKIYPYSAWILQNTKEFHGIDYILDKEYNVYNAVKEYGMEWLER